MQVWKTRSTNDEAWMPKKQAAWFWSEIQIPRFLRHSDFVIQSLKSSSSFEEKLEAVQATCDTKSRR
jgi:hypothetical protein